MKTRGAYSNWWTWRRSLPEGTKVITVEIDFKGFSINVLGLKMLGACPRIRATA